MVNLTPREEDITGASLSDSSGDKNRTYTLVYKNPNDVRIWINGVYLHTDTDFTRSDTTITFINAIFNNQLITIRYNTTAATVSDDV